jgi:tetrahydromethanopterin S-methyltransferase subunit G
MKTYPKFTRFVCIFMVFSLFLLNVSVSVAQAKMISTEASMAVSRSAENRALIKTHLQRAEVRQVLADQGVDAAEVEKRVDALSDAEVAQIADQVAGMPAGGGAFGVIIGAALFVFVVLLITDIAGWTDVYPFVTKYQPHARN